MTEEIINTGVQEKEAAKPSWRDSLADEYRSHSTIGNYEDINDFAKDFINKEKLIGQKGSPKADAPPEEWNKWFQEKGLVPKEVTGYGREEEGLQDFLKAAHNSGLSKYQVDNILKYVQTENKRIEEASNKQYQDTLNKLAEKYGGEDKAKDILAQADKYAADTFGDFPEFFDFLSNTEVDTPDGKMLLGNHPIIAEALKIMFEKTGDDNKKVDGEATVDSGDALQQFQELTAKMLQYKGDKYDPDYVALQKQLQKAQQKMLGL